MSTQNLVMIAAIFWTLGVVLEAAPPKPWSQFNPPAMTIVYPEQTALSNPPWIHWHGHPEAKRYRIELASVEASHSWETPWNFFLTDVPLDPGFYQVRIHALDESGRPLAPAATRDFNVVLSANPRVPALNDVRAPKNAPLLLTPDQLKRLKTAGGETAQNRKTLIEAAATVNPRIAGALQEPVRYKDHVWDFKTWQQNNSYCFTIEDAVLTHSLAYLIEGDPRYFETVRRLALGVTAWSADGATGVWENDHSAQAILHVLSVAYSTFADRWTAEEKRALVQALQLRCEDMYAFLNPFVMKEISAGPMNDPDNNHPWFCATALGMGALALMEYDPRAPEWASYAAQLYWGLFLPKGDRTGGWHEGIDYWSYSLLFVFQLCDALKSAAGINLYQHPWLQNTAFFKIYTHPPVGAYVPFGDCKHHLPNAFDRVIMMRLASEYGDPLAWKYVDAIEVSGNQPRFLPYAFRWSDRSTVVGLDIPALPFVRHFEDIGWVVSNSDVFNTETQRIFAFRSGKFHGRSFGHTHADLNSFIFTAGGDKLLWDAGYYDSYLSPHHRNFARLSDAHNTILVDGIGQVVHIRGLDGKISRFETEGTDLRVQGDASELLIYGGRLLRFLRTIHYSDQRRLEIEDDLFARELSQFSYLLHSAFPIHFDPRERTLRIRGNHFELTGQFLTTEPIEAILRNTFPHPPKLTSQVLPAEDVYPNQYHLELKTVNKIESWTPKLIVELRPIAP